MGIRYRRIMRRRPERGSAHVPVGDLDRSAASEVASAAAMLESAGISYTRIEFAGLATILVHGIDAEYHPGPGSRYSELLGVAHKSLWDLGPGRDGVIGFHRFPPASRRTHDKLFGPAVLRLGLRPNSPTGMNGLFNAPALAASPGGGLDRLLRQACWDYSADLPDGESVLNRLSVGYDGGRSAWIDITSSDGDGLAALTAIRDLVLPQLLEHRVPTVTITCR